MEEAPLDAQNVVERIRREDQNGVAFIWLDRHDSTANILDMATMSALERQLDSLSGESRVTGLVIASSKPGIFLAGADLPTLKSATLPELREFLEQGQRVFQKLADLPVPTLAAMHGAVMGGGLELALACDWRITSPAAETKLAFPETKLGLLPAWGGSTRLPRLIGLPAALDLILTGRTRNSFQALSLGLIDEIVPRERFVEYAPKLLSRKPKRKQHWLVHNPLSVALIRWRVGADLKKSTRGLYPAQETALDVVCQAVSGSVEASLMREREAFLRLAPMPQARELLRVFLLGERAKKCPLSSSLEAVGEISLAAVVGAGLMGAGIAQGIATRGIPVRLGDLDEVRLGVGVGCVDKLLGAAAKKGAMTEGEARHARDLICPVAGRMPLGRVDLVIEAVVEDMSVKKKIFADLSARAGSRTILATNTSALSVTELAEASGVVGPERVIGLHFFNPVHQMPLVEIIITKHTTPEVVEGALRFIRRIGKTPILAKDSPGFIVNRILMPYLIEAGRMFESGTEAWRIDEAMLDFGMPMGPLRLLDEVGLDVAAHVAETMESKLGERFHTSQILKALVGKGQLGRKKRAGFYIYHGVKPVVNPVAEAMQMGTAQADSIAATLVALMSEEAQRVFEEGVSPCPDYIDLAMVFGTGYAPFRGGPLRHAEQPQPIKSAILV